MRLALIATITLLAAEPATAAEPTPVEVHLSNFKFAPKTIELKAGQDYALTLINDSGGGHSFAAKEFFKAAGAASGDIEVPGGERRVIRLRAPRAGTYKAKCTHTFHGAMGMKGEIIVR